MQCNICNIKLTTNIEVDAHFSGKKHQKKLNSKERTEEGLEAKSIFVSRLGNLTISSIQHYFSQFGTVCNIIPLKDKQVQQKLHATIVEFEEEDTVTRVLDRTGRITHKVPLPNGDQLQLIRVQERKVRAHTVKPRSPSPPAATTISLAHIKLQLSLVSCDPDEQMRQVVTLTEMDAEDIEERNKLCSHIRNTFARNGYPACVVYPFGSTVNGLAFKGCDLDVNVDLGEIPASSVSSAGPSAQSQIPVSLTEAQKVRIAANLLREIPNCSRIVPISQARVPIVKFVHRVTGIQCDISFKNKSAVLNSEFIRFCSEVDSRVRPLIMTVKLFCKMHDLSGSGGGRRMSSYALVMLVIFYLQQLEKPILPSVHSLQKNFQGSHAVMIGGWNYGFCDSIDSLDNMPANKQDVVELLQGFFAYYSLMDFSSVVISPHLGRLLLRQEQSLPKEFEGMIEKPIPALDSHTCVQDPFELNFNLTKNLGLTSIAHIKTFFVQASGICRTLINPDPGEKISGGINLLWELEGEKCANKLLNQIPGSKVYLSFQLPMLYTGFEQTRNVVHTVLEQCLRLNRVEQKTDDENVKVEPSTCSDIADKIDKEKKNTEDENSKQSESAASSGKRKLSDITTQVDKKKSRGKTSIKDLLIEVWQLDFPVWVGRKKLLGAISEEAKTAIQKEAEISKAQREREIANNQLEKEVFKTYLFTINDEPYMGLESVESKKNQSETLFTWLRSGVPYIMAKIKRDEIDNMQAST